MAMDRYLALVYLTEAGQSQDAWGELNRALKQFTGKGLPHDRAAAQFTTGVDKKIPAGPGWISTG